MVILRAIIIIVFTQNMNNGVIENNESVIANYIISWNIVRLNYEMSELEPYRVREILLPLI